MVYGTLVHRRFHVNAAEASKSLFSPWNRDQLQELDAVCIDVDRVLANDDLDTCFQLIDQSTNIGLQVFLIGSRENLLSVPELREKDVTFIEKTDELATASGERQAEAISELLERIYAPFRSSDEEYLVNQEGIAMSEIAVPLDNSEKKIDPGYFQPVLTDEQRKAYFAFLRTPEGHDGFLPPGVENA